jgi:hypothetical protein
VRANASWFAGPPESRIRQIEARPPIEQNGGTIRIGETTHSPLYRNISISYELLVPADTSLADGPRRTGTSAQAPAPS